MYCIVPPKNIKVAEDIYFETVLKRNLRPWFWELSPSAMSRQTGREADRLLHWLQHKTRAGRGSRTHVLCCSLWPSQQVTFRLGRQQLIHCEEKDTEEGNEGEREGAEREIKSITIDSCVRDGVSRRVKMRGKKVTDCQTGRGEGNEQEG